MIIIAERINATRKRIARALEERDAELIKKEAVKQTKSGANYIDVNAGSNPAKEVENLCWLVETVQEASDLPLTVDSANAEALREALKRVKNKDVMINSINGEAERMESVIPLAAEYNAKLVALTMDEDGLPTTVDQRVHICGKMVEATGKAGVGIDRLYVDPCIQPLSTSPDQVHACIDAIVKIKSTFQGIKTTCGLSNISFGLPYRGIINRVFMTFMIEGGLDSAVIDPTEQDMVATILATEALTGRDDYCMNYIGAERDGRLQQSKM